MENEVIFYTYGLCTMFYAMMAWIFWRRGFDKLSRLVMILMMIISISLIKDLFFLHDEMNAKDWNWIMMTAVDMVAEPFYAFILIELCRPGTLSKKMMLCHEAPFVLLPILLYITRIETFYDILVAWSAIYGVYYAIWTLIEIPRYHKILKERFSYEENINLNWLRIIMFSFFAILTLWVVDSVIANIYIESAYMIGSMVIWMFICSFIYRHESVLSELTVAGTSAKEDMPKDEDINPVDIGIRIEHLMLIQKAYLNPQIKLSDVAKQIGSNRTYVSNWFNRNRQSSFFDYVNDLRVEFACTLLETSDMSLGDISHESGFNSKATFYRLFKKLKGCTPNEFRDKCKTL